MDPYISCKGNDNRNLTNTRYHGNLKVICNVFRRLAEVVSSCWLKYKSICVINFDNLCHKMLKSRSLAVILRSYSSATSGNHCHTWRHIRCACFVCIAIEIPWKVILPVFYYYNLSTYDQNVTTTAIDLQSKLNTQQAVWLFVFLVWRTHLQKVNKSSVRTFRRFFLKLSYFLMFFHIQIDLFILKTDDKQFTLTTKNSLHITFKHTHKQCFCTLNGSLNCDGENTKQRLTVDEEKKHSSFDIVVSVGHKTGDFETETGVFHLHIQQLSTTHVLTIWHTSSQSSLLHFTSSSSSLQHTRPHNLTHVLTILTTPLHIQQLSTTHTSSQSDTRPHNHHYSTSHQAVALYNTHVLTI